MIVEDQEALLGMCRIWCSFYMRVDDPVIVLGSAVCHFFIKIGFQTFDEDGRKLRQCSR